MILKKDRFRLRCTTARQVARSARRHPAKTVLFSVIAPVKPYPAVVGEG